PWCAGDRRLRSSSSGLEEVIMTTLWITIVAVALASAAIKAAGPVLVGGRDLPPQAVAIIALLAPTLLAALVVTETFGEDQHLVLDERAMGITVAAMALLLRAPVLLALGLAVVATALARTVG
ncbi:MAG: AzlD domain-containing protein, partial [Actinomycetota bacterium]|nr:AzlD domain-containing protein [Actinomycetota bacterium]